MSSKSSIEWTDATWSPLRARVKKDAAQIAADKGYTSLIQIAQKMAGHVGPHCEHVSPGCENCYAETNNCRRLPANGTGLPFDRRARDLVDPFVDEKILTQPLHWKKPRRIFVENQADLFGEWIPDDMIDRVFAVMALCPHHTFQVLTKRPARMSRYFDTHHAHGLSKFDDIRKWAALITRTIQPEWELPLTNVHLGVSCENQATADERIPLLLQTPAAVRFISYEPALGPVTFRWAKWEAFRYHPFINDHLDGLRRLDWVIAGGESGPNARPAHPEWFRDVRDECVAAGVPFFFKQWGAWTSENTDAKHKIRLTLQGRNGSDLANAADGYEVWMSRVGKKAAGRLLDGREWNEFPRISGT